MKLAISGIAAIALAIAVFLSVDFDPDKAEADPSQPTSVNGAVVD